jgi:cytochrome c
LAEALAEGLSVGYPDMPELAFEPDQIAAILAYLKSIQEHWLDIAGLRITAGNFPL